MSPDRPAFRGAQGGLSLALLLALGACESVPMASQQEDATAKRFERPGPDRGTLYVYRRGWMALAKNVDVSIANGPRAALAPDTYLMLDGPPGLIEVACQADNTDTKQIRVEPGETRYVEVAMQLGWWGPRCEIAEVPPDKGQAAVRGAKRVVAQGS